MGGQSLRQVVREIIAKQAPGELTLLDGMASLDDGEITRVFRRSRERRDPLGFGVTEVAALVTPVVWLVVNELAQRGAAAAVDGASRRGLAWLRRLRGQPSPPMEVPPLSPTQLTEVRAKVHARALAAGMESGQAEGLADAVVSGLAVSPEES
ncbi:MULTISPECIES: hypothetical protein [unclassified Streptomyces]|uniref:hypothetical protein n=1 Tax=unclassified Streptomyces TaxID=2593676 RepID=UPI002365E8F3|nr:MULTISPECIES: hypothetical protein [unclassified Streptomyces]MDF3142295.1 hypothetical protein [Streptomyces sp. T21Q-yed]WDF36244.1 hypothetical protein PBV52_05380 [Streptomyces sp. T12]